MFEHHRAMIYHTPETTAIHREEERDHMAVYEQRRSVFLPPEAVQRTRYTCRDEEMRARLLDGINVMDAIEHLCRIEEKLYGVLIKRRPGKEANDGR